MTTHRTPQTSSRVAQFALAVLLLGSCAASLGCRACASPYDYCGPLFTGECDNCDMNNPRRGSAFGGGPWQDGLVVESQHIDGEMLGDESGDTIYESGEEYYEDSPEVAPPETLPAPRPIADPRMSYNRAIQMRR